MSKVINRYFIDGIEIELDYGRRTEGMIVHWRFKGDNEPWRLVLNAYKGKGAKEKLMNCVVFDATPLVKLKKGA